ncbi:MAG: hypothetical protein HC772_06545 [Leptolyngbyaceae cyanobacterium CRU_2_3]|nr:hypothetical protein [Leptolyngbyaceae cyanobacterium CRU_2_3]
MSSDLTSWLAIAASVGWGGCLTNSFSGDRFRQCGGATQCGCCSGRSSPSRIFEWFSPNQCSSPNYIPSPDLSDHTAARSSTYWARLWAFLATGPLGFWAEWRSLLLVLDWW